MRLFALSGSLRADSANTRLLQTVQRLAPHNLSVELFDALEQFRRSIRIVTAMLRRNPWPHCARI